MRIWTCLCGVSLSLMFANLASAQEPVPLSPTLIEVQKFCAARVATLPKPASAAEWEPLAAKLREATLANAVYRGEAAKWRDAELGVEWLETIPGGPGYSIRKLRYEALPGLWIPALLYVPEKIVGKVPVFLNVNGHDPVGKAVDYKQMRCINQAKRGIIVLNPEWFGMGQFRTDGYAHGRMNQLDLCGTSGLAPFYLSMKRGLDVLLSLPEADASRVGVSGLSGGGWQTIVISALDTRVTLSNPVAGYSSFITRGKNFSDLGDSEQTPVDLAVTADYSHLTALMAPRATLLTYNLNDNCCFKADHALPPLLEAARPFFRLYGQDDSLRYHINAEPGDHNYQKENREALYQMMGRQFFPDDRNYSALEIPSAGEIKSPEQLQIAVPEGNANFNTLALALAKDLPREAQLPTTRNAVASWQAERRKKLTEIVRPKVYTPSVAAGPLGEVAGTPREFRLKLGDDWTVPLTIHGSDKSAPTVLLLADAGRAQSQATVEKLLANRKRVVTFDPFYFGDCKIGQRDYLFALLVSAVGERPLGVQASQVAAVARWLRGDEQAGPVMLLAEGPRTSLIALAAAAIEEEAIGGVELHGAPGSLKELLEQNRSVEQSPEQFCFGLLEWFDIRQLAALVAPRPVRFTEPGDRVRREMEGLSDLYQQLGKPFDPVRFSSP